MVTNLISNVVNVIFNYLLIGGNLGFPELGVRGAAMRHRAGHGVRLCPEHRLCPAEGQLYQPALG